MRIAVLGAGGVGGLVAAALARDGTDTTVVAREETARVLGLEGLHVTSAVLGDFAVRPRVTARLEQPVDALLVATKAAGLAEGLDRVAAEPALAVPLLNG
ncbi:MAG TPA: 2-dehydropantoate 2-reductase N-terminal domain-containing protein, partial [Solirubrobacteraceae bacterium]|nr:2-dehydropantoate 2-reductase N-terminal domain-containing protein [Solirubrobacteraceae bacterium]